jgi:hypothetical protein
MVRHRHSNCRVLGSHLQHNVTAAPANLNESLARKNSAKLGGRTRSLPNLDLKAGNEDFGVTAAFNLRRISRLKK